MTNARTTLINLTPHPITLLGDGNNPLVTIAPSGIVARREELQEAAETILVGSDRIPVHQKRYGPLVGLPDSVPGTTYLASALAATAAYAMGRRDVYCPNELIRGEAGEVLGCRSLALCAPPSEAVS